MCLYEKYNGTTYLPVRAIAGLMGKDVGWDGATSTITLTTPQIINPTVGDTISNDVWKMTLISANTFGQFGNGYFISTPENGNIFLVFFFEVENISKGYHYFNSSNY